MAEPAAIGIPLESVTVARSCSIAVVGNPNSGKSTLFNRVTGLNQRTANYPGVTVEKRTGKLTLGSAVFDLIDLPGIYSLSPESTDERIVVDVLLGRVPGTPQPNAILAVVDSTRLYQGLYLLQQLAELGRPMAVVLTMADDADERRIAIDCDALGAKLGGVPVCQVVATTGKGFSALRSCIVEAIESSNTETPLFWPALRHEAVALEKEVRGSDASLVDIERALIDDDPVGVEVIRRALGPEGDRRIVAHRNSLCGDDPPLAVESRARYRWIAEVLPQLQSTAPAPLRFKRRIVDWINRPYPATALFLLLMATVFQAVFAWATPMMDLIDAAAGGMGGWVQNTLPAGAFASFLADGVIAGVGSVVIFLPQILILFLFIILMEDTGYLARTAFLMDRAMRAVGLSGQSVVPLISGFACAVPSIMATRVIPNRRDRIATIMATPFMTCSARLPIYALLIAAFVPNLAVGFANLQGLVLFGLYLLGILGGIGTALLLRKSALRGPKPSFVLALPEFRMPNVRTVLMKLLDRALVFLRRAGTVIFAVAVVVWALAYFPRAADIESQRLEAQTEIQTVLQGEALAAEIARIDNEAAAAQLAQSWLGRMGQGVEPLFRPLGWDWRVSAAVIAGFPAREVVVAVLGTIYAVGSEADESSLADRLTTATWPDGRTVFTLPMVLGLLLFYALCLQCAATLAVIKRETNTWGWPLFAWGYMTALGYVGALLIFQIGSV